mmetsp:Transcript_2008/g.7814  ORF Transcript_2008/g.7814 Transcript_2008/m.7814 type:complete len:294 (+) Transcript_2008:1227-2108(+)
MSFAMGMMATDMFTLSMLHRTNAQHVPSRMRYRDGMERQRSPRSSSELGNLGSHAGNSPSAPFASAAASGLTRRRAIGASDSSSSSSPSSSSPPPLPPSSPGAGSEKSEEPFPPAPARAIFFALPVDFALPVPRPLPFGTPVAGSFVSQNSLNHSCTFAASPMSCSSVYAQHVSGSVAAGPPLAGQHAQPSTRRGVSIACSTHSLGAACAFDRRYRTEASPTQKSSRARRDAGGLDACLRATRRRNQRALRRGSASSSSAFGSASEGASSEHCVPDPRLEVPPSFPAARSDTG